MTAMTADVFAAARAAAAPERVFVVTADPPPPRRAGRRLDGVARDDAGIGKRSVDALPANALQAASPHCCAALRLPLVTGADIDAVFAARPDAPGALLVPSRDGTGTNAILRTPPRCSRRISARAATPLHKAEAVRAGAGLVEFRSARIEMDVDDAEDLAALLRTGSWRCDRGAARRNGGAHAARIMINIKERYPAPRQRAAGPAGNSIGPFPPGAKLASHPGAHA